MDKNFYKSISLSDALEQGDIFDRLPIFNLDSEILTQMIVKESTPGNYDFDSKEIDLKDYVPDETEKIENVISSVLWRPGIIITQNCDVVREDYLSFCEIRKLEDVDKQYAGLTKLDRKVEFLAKKEYKHQYKYFYLLQNQSIFNDNKMVVDFSRIYQVKREIIENLKNKRMIGLSSTPLEHLKIKLSNYFKRFAYDGWYVLNKEEYSVYCDFEKKNKISDEEFKLIKPYPWHQ